MAIDLNDPRYEEILELQKLIEQKDAEIKANSTEFNPELAAIPGAPKPAFNPDNVNALNELNTLITQQSELQADIYHEQIRKVDTPPELVTNDEELDTPTESYSNQFTEQDLINSYRSKLGDSYTDKQILDYVSFVNPEQYNAVVGTLEEEESVESPGFFEITKNAWNQAWENEKITNKYYTPAFQLGDVGLWQHVGSSPSEMDFKVKDALKLLPEFSNIPEEDLDNKVLQLKQDGKFKDDVIKSLLSEGMNELDESIKSNEEALAVSKYLEDSDGWLFDKNGDLYIHKWIGNSAASGVVSVMNSRKWGLIGALPKYAAPYIAVQPVLGARPAAAVSYAIGTLGEYLGQMYYGYNMEGAGFYAESYNELTKDKVLTKKEFQRDIADKRRIFGNHVDEDGKKPSYSQVQSMLDQYYKDNFVEKDGQIVRLAMDEDEALQGIKIATGYAAATSSAIESIDVFAKNVTFGVGLKGPMQMLSFGKYISKADDIIRTAPIVKHWKDLRKIDPSKNKISNSANKIIDIAVGKASDNVAEGVEEVFQLASNTLYQTKGIGEDDFKIGVGQVFSDRWDWKQARESFAGGYFGSRLFNTGVNAVKFGIDATGIQDKLRKTPVGIQFKNNANSGLFVERDGNQFKLFQGISEIDEKTGKVSFQRINAELKDPTSGDKMSNVYSTEKEANEVANRLNLERRTTNEKIIAGLNKWMYNSEAKVEKDGEAWAVNIYGGDGKLKNKQARFKKRIDANEKAASLKKDILNVTSTIDKYGIDNVTSIANKVNKKIAKIKSLNENTEDVKGLPFIKKGNKKILSENAGRVLIKGYMQGTEKKDTNEIVEIAENEEDLHALIREQGLHEDPKVLSDVLNEYPDLFTEEGISPDDFIKSFKTDFENYQDFINEDKAGRTSNFIDEMPLVDDVKKEYEGIQDEFGDILEDKPPEDLPTAEEEEIITKGKAADLFKTPIVKKEKKTPEDIDMDSPEFIKETKDKIARLQKEIKLMEDRGEDVGKRKAEWYGKLQEVKALWALIPGSAPMEETSTEEAPIPKNKVTEKIKKVTSEYKGQELLIKYEKYDKPFKVTMKDIEFLSSHIIDGVETKKYPSARGITSQNKEVSFHHSEIIDGPPDLIKKLKEIYSLEENNYVKIKESKTGIKHLPESIKENLTDITKQVGDIIKNTEGSFFRGGKHKAVWFGPAPYEYTGAKHTSKPIPDILLELKSKVEKAFALGEGYYDSVLANSYMPGVGLNAHQDNEELLRLADGSIGSVGTLVLGGEAEVYISQDGEVKETHLIKDGDMYEFPAGDFQDLYFHAVGPSKKQRISLTFRRTKLAEEQPAKQMELKGVVEKKSIEEYRADNLKLNTGQIKALKFLDKEVITKDKNIGKKETIVAGYAGTGKTTIIENIVRQGLNKDYIVHVAAPTNKAVMVLMDKAPDDLWSSKRLIGDNPVNYTTIHKLIYGEPSKETGVFKAEEYYGKENLIIIDESSMIDAKMYKDLHKHVIKEGGKIVFMGDGFQLPPVGEDPHIMDRADIVLKEVMRQGLKSKILSYATSLRNRALQGDFEMILPSASKKDVKITNNLFSEYMQSLQNGDNSILITSKNDVRVNNNKNARRVLFGDNAPAIVKNEQLVSIANSDLKVNGEVFNLLEPKIIRKLKVEYSVWKNQTKQLDTADAYHIEDMGRSYLLFPENIQSSVYHQIINNNTTPDSWRAPKNRPGIKKSITIATYGYSITGHKSQGGQWDKVFVDTDIIFRGDSQARWLYTAITRAEKDLYIADSPVGKTPWSQIDAMALKSSDKKFAITRGMAIPQSPANQAKTKKYVKMMFDKFEGKIPYEFVNNPEMRNETGNIVSAYYSPKDKKVVVNLAYAKPETGFHEYMHPFIIEMRQSNPKLFNNLLNEILDTNDGKELFKDIIDIYNDKEINSNLSIELSDMMDKVDSIKDLSGKELYNLLKSNDDKGYTLSDELIAFAVSEEALGYVPKESKFKKIIKKIIDWVRYKLFGPNWTAGIYAKTMDENTSVSDIAKLLANSQRKFSLERVDKKLVNSQYDFAIDNKPKFIAHTEKKIELSDANEKDKAWLDRFYGSIWDDAGMVGYTKKEDFASVMIPLLGDELFGSFSTWYRRKFKSKKVPNVNDEFTGKDSLYDVAKIHVDKNDDLLRKIRDNGMGSDEKALPAAKLFYLRAFGITLHKSELNTLIKLAKNLDRSGRGYNEWKDMIFKKGEPLYGQRKDMAKWQERGLKRYHAQLLSTSKVNRGDALQEITNYEMLMNRVLENGILKYKFNFRKKGPEKTYRERIFDFEKGKYIYNEKKGNIQFQKKTLFDNILENSGLFGWLSGTDIKTIKYHKDDAKQLIMDEQGQFLSDVKSLYGFLNQDELMALDSKLINSHGLTIAFSRGDSDKIAITPITKEALEHAKNKDSVTAYLKNEFNTDNENLGYMTKKQAQLLWKDIMSTSSVKERAAIISSHEAMKKVWPKYALDTKGPANVYKRLKIPFTPTTVAKGMEPLRTFKFDPHKVKFQYGNNEPYSPIQLGEYIGDGETPTSANAFKKFDDAHGLNADIAKTVHYLTSGDNTYALKHQHFIPTRNWKIINNKGTLFQIDDKRNIYLGSAHPNYIEGGDNYVDMIGTYNEIKIGTEKEGIFSESDELYVPGSAVGFIKYEESMPAHSKHPQQWYNHIDDPKILKHFSDTYMPIVENKLRNAIRVAIDTNQSTSAEKIAKLLEVLEGKDEMGRYPTLLELVRLGAGKHLQTANVVDKLIQTRMIEPALQLDGMSGSIYNIAMDVTNSLEAGEVAISRQKAKAVLDKFKKANPEIKSMKNVSNEEINTWLSNNPVYAMVTRFPVPHAGGALMARVKMIHDRKGVVSMNVYDVKVRLEGDNDGDHVEIEFLQDSIVNDFKEYLDKLKINPLDLNDFVNENIKQNMFTSKGKANLISKLTAGQRAIGEIANVQAAYGSMVQVYNSLKHPEHGQVFIKQRDENIDFKVYYNKKTGWKGPVSEYLRIWLQAAVDNGKFGLLGEWNYDRNSLIRDLFEDEYGNDISDEAFANIVLPVFNLHLEANRIRNGFDFYTGKYSFKNTLNKSKEYDAYASNRADYLSRNNKIEVDIKNNNLTPIEQIATSPSRILDEMVSEPKYNLFGYQDSPYIMEIDLHQNSHRETMMELDTLKESYFENAAEKDGISGNLESIKAEMKKGRDYADRMGTKLENLIGEYLELGPQSMDYNDNFLSWIEQYDGEFNSLSETAKTTATYRYLQGFTNLNTKKESNISGTHLPAVSESPGQPTLLDAKMIKDYFKKYNNQIKDNQNLGSLKNVRYRGFISIAKGLCE